MPDVFSVLLASEEQLQLAPLGQALAAFKRVPLPDAAHEAKNCWGLVAESVAVLDADRLLACLTAANLKALKRPQAELRPLPPVSTLLHASFTADGFSGIDDQGNRISVMCPQICVVCAASMKSTSSKTVVEKQGPTSTQKALSIGIMMATGLPIGIGPKKKTVERKVSETETSFLLDVVTDAPLSRVRIFADRVNYTSLKERMLYNVMGNFKLVLADLVARTPRARLGKGTRVLLAGQPVNTMGYEDLSDLERESRWLFSIPKA